MTQQDALGRAVCELPDEDTPRLIFADHLEESGDARRAAFIRTQVQLARVPEYDSLWAECRLRNPDAIRGWTLAHTLPSLPDGVSWRRFQFRRGFPWLASATDISDLLNSDERLFTTAPVQALELNHDCGIVANWDAFVEWPHLAKLTRLEFTHTRLDATALRKLARSPFSRNLRELSFDGDAIAAEGLHELAESELFPRLRRLELRHAALPPALMMDALAAAPAGLRELVLAECKLPDPDAAYLLQYGVVKDLTLLDLSSNPLREGALALASGIGCEVVRLKETFPNVTGVRSLLHSVRRGARLLDLSFNRLGPASVKLLAGSAALSDLRVFDLSHNPIGDSGARMLAESPHLGELVELDLRGCELGTDSLTTLRRRFGAALRTDAVHKTPS